MLAHDYVSASTERHVSCVGRFHSANLSQVLSVIQGHLLGASLDMLIPLGISLPFLVFILHLTGFFGSLRSAVGACFLVHVCSTGGV